MSEDLLNEVEAINSIYGDLTLSSDVDDHGVYVLNLPQHAVALRLQFPSDYPSAPPTILGTQSSGERKGEAAQFVEEFRDAVGRLFQPGEVCLFDAIEEVNSNLAETTTTDEVDNSGDGKKTNEPTESTSIQHDILPTSSISPPWVLSEVVIELKSVFVARCAQVSSPDQATQYLQHLLDTDKKVRSATHNITAWRIQGENGVTFQDCDDDGETAAGGRVLHLMQLMDLWNVMVVVTRWYGGHQLGPKRFSIINTVARDAFVRGGYVREDTSAKKKGKH
ncbi:Ribosomal protein S5 2-like protein [Glarea lozoyensis ATCC 20868]|uniref:Ribosomal protein S5 2-like protein n=1 Tax=Glarea lozoyensis (strain ATCC 20868 / MF5171) TaxID=1116229 RepID=S3CHS5_GLAL2|nr:Ribosomal protein S5 2-like protein [Glarea lozoyensis ATCC 20868]EPE24809.1 Ribosomal protein S5 2-like protein [Glarea lozoyensis ATCC 20868]